MAAKSEKRYKYRNKNTGAEFISSSICCGDAWELIKILRTTAKTPEGKAPKHEKPVLAGEEDE